MMMSGVSSRALRISSVALRASDDVVTGDAFEDVAHAQDHDLVIVGQQDSCHVSRSLFDASSEVAWVCLEKCRAIAP